MIFQRDLRMLQVTLRQHSFNWHFTPKAHGNSLIRNAQFNRPLSHRQRLTVKSKPASITPVKNLFGARCPFAIFLAIRSIVVFSFQRMLCSWTLPHIFIKLRKRIPFLAHLYSAPGIILRSLNARIIAARSCCSPNSIFWCPLPSSVAMKFISWLTFAVPHWSWPLSVSTVSLSRFLFLASNLRCNTLVALFARRIFCSRWLYIREYNHAGLLPLKSFLCSYPFTDYLTINGKLQP